MAVRFALPISFVSAVAFAVHHTSNVLVCMHTKFTFTCMRSSKCVNVHVHDGTRLNVVVIDYKSQRLVRPC